MKNIILSDIHKETVNAYSDCNEECIRNTPRNLDFKADVMLDLKGYVRTMKSAVPDGYNEFNINTINKQLKEFPDLIYVPAREGSVCLYVKGFHSFDVITSFLSAIKKCTPDEISIQGAWIKHENFAANIELRIWWD